jgi:hypothetical protein
MAILFFFVHRWLILAPARLMITSTPSKAFLSKTPWLGLQWYVLILVENGVKRLLVESVEMR